MPWAAIAYISYAAFLSVFAILLWLYSQPPHVDPRCDWCNSPTTDNENRVLDGDLLCPTCADIWVRGEAQHAEDTIPCEQQ